MNHKQFRAVLQNEAVNAEAGKDATEAFDTGATPALAAQIAAMPIPSLRAAMMRSIEGVPDADAAFSSPGRRVIGEPQAPIIRPTAAESSCAPFPGASGYGPGLPGIVWTDIGAITAYDGPYTYPSEVQAGWAVAAASFKPHDPFFQGRVRAEGTASPLNLATAQPAGTESNALGLRLEVTVPGDSAPSSGNFVITYVDGGGAVRTLNLSAIPIAGRVGIIRILPGLTALFGRPARHSLRVNNARVVTSTGLLAPVTAVTVAFTGFPANTPVAAELIQPGSPTFLADIAAFANTKS